LAWSRAQMQRAVRAGLGLASVARPRLADGGEDGVLLRVRYAGVNRPDVLQDAGLYPARPGVSDVLGLEVAGEVVEASAGARARGLREGDAVCALVPGGGYAEYCAASASHCLPVPRFGADAGSPAAAAAARQSRAAALPETCFTVWRNLMWAGPATMRGKSVFVHGGAGGIGSTAIALAKAFGAAEVQATAGGEAKRRFCEDECGANRAFDYRADPAWWSKAGKADVVLDCVGGSYLEPNLGLLKDNGRLVIIGFLQGAVSQVNMTRVLLKSLTITGSVLRSAPDSDKARLRDALLEHVWPRLDDGSLNLPPRLDVLDGLERYKAAHATMTSSPSFCGKLVLRVDS
jgi:NADPH2:quinone reductase